MLAASLTQGQIPQCNKLLLEPKLLSLLQGGFVLDADDACHVLTVETGGPISSVALQSNVLLDLEECAVAILSLSPPDPSNRSMTLATYRWVLHGQMMLAITTA